MIYYVLKTVVTAALIVVIAEISKRSTFWGAVLASIPLISVMAMVWIYVDTKDVAKISAFSAGVFWLVLPSLPFFIILPIMLEKGVGFYTALALSLVVTALCFWGMVAVLGHYGVKL